MASLAADRACQREAIARRAEAKAANLAELQRRYPLAFDPDRPIALALDTNQQIKAALGLSNSATNDVLRPLILAPAYLSVIAAGGNRFNLDGTVAGPISEEHQRNAADRLRAMSKFRSQPAV